jgi:hypothetical protein
MTAKTRPPRILPAGYRIRYRLFLWPVEIDGRYRWLEYVPIVQRFTGNGDVGDAMYDFCWHDVGFFDEFPGDTLEAWDGEIA